MPKISGNDILKIALANDHVGVPAEALEALKATKRHSKYGNVHCEFDGLRFASKAELNRYADLRLLQLTGAISNLTTQPVFQLTGKVKYIADFQYVENGRTICEDVKGGNGTVTAVFRVKWKQVRELYPSVEFRLITT